MIFRPYYYFDRGCAAYLFGCGTLGRCAVVGSKDWEQDSFLRKGTNSCHAYLQFCIAVPNNGPIDFPSIRWRCGSSKRRG